MTQQTDMGTRRFGRINWRGVLTLAERENRRFLSIWTQTLAGPLVTAGLFVLIFNLAIGPRRGEVMGVPFIEFLAPGILMMTVIQNAFANTSSSIMVAKMQGNIVDTLMPPLSAAELVTGYVMGGIGRGVMVGIVLLLALMLGLGMSVVHPIWALLFVLLGATVLASLGIIAAIFAKKFDQMAAITNFVITPLSFLSGTFYSLEALPPIMQTLSHINPMFYMIDGVRFGVLGVSDSSPWLAFAVCLASSGGLLLLCWSLFRSGYRLKP